MSSQLEIVHCPLCGGQKQDLRLQAPDRFNLETAEYRIVTCVDCGCIFLNPRPTLETIGEFYEGDAYDPFSSVQSDNDFWSRIYRAARSFTVRNKRRRIERLKSGGNILDAGCGTGEFLHEMQSNGWQASGVETDKRAADFAVEHYGLNVRNSDLEAGGFAAASFDVVTMWHVLEHIFEPRRTLKKISELLKDDGVVLIAAPNISSFDARFYQSNWVALDSPRHVVHFTPASMHAFAESAGFKLVSYHQMLLDAAYNCLMSEQLLKQRGKKLWAPFHLMRALAIAKISGFISLRLLNKRRGSSILYYLTKK